MKDILQDIVSHTQNLGFLTTVKVTGTDKGTTINSMADDRSVIMEAETAAPYPDMIGVFGMPQLNKLKYLIEGAEYKENAKIAVTKEQRNGNEIPTGIHFENAAGDFVNDYRFMVADIINEKLKTAKFKGASWDVEFQPSLASIQRLKLQAGAHTEEKDFRVKTEGGNLIFFFGDAGTHAGSFVFQADVKAKFKNNWAWPVQQVMSILNLGGDITMKLTDAGAMQITVDSGLAEYNYILPAQSK